MGEYLRPDVYVEEVVGAVQPIEGVGTTTAGFVVVSEMGPIDEATLVTSMAQYERIFGGAYAPSGFGRCYGYHAVRGFFENGGKRAYIVRVQHRSSGAITAVKATKALNDTQGSPVLSLTVDAKTHGLWGNNLAVGIKHNPKCSTTLAVSALSTDTVLKLTSGFGLVPGSEIKIEGSTGTKRYAKVVSIAPGNPTLVTIEAQVGNAFASGSTVVSEEFDVYVYRANVLKEKFTQVTNVSSYLGVPNANFVEGVINDTSFGSALITVTANASNTSTYLRHPAQTLDGSGNVSPSALASGSDGLTSFADTDVVGSSSIPSGLQALMSIDNLSMVACPGWSSATVVDGLRTFVETKRYSFANVAASSGLTISTVQTYRGSTPGLDSGRVALYWPWVKVSDPIGSGRQPMVLVPAEGHVMGVDARTDINRGVFKAGAGSVDAQLRGVFDTEVQIDKGMEDILNPLSINSIVKRQNRGIFINGGRTCATLPEQRYKSVMRTLIFLEQSLDNSLSWADWEPNNPALWERLRINITAFFKARWDEGYLMGSSMKEAFYVKVDASNNPPSAQNEGKVYVDIGVAIVKPAEFVIIRVSQWDGGRLVQELGLAS